MKPLRLTTVLLSLGSLAAAGCATTRGLTPAAEGGPAAAPGLDAAALAAGRWEILEAEGTPVKRHECALAEAGGRLFLIGGRGIKPVDIFDPATRRWTQGATPPEEIHHFQAVSHGGLVYVVGALTGRFPAEPAVSHVLVYDPARDQWRRGPEVPEGRRRGAAGAVFHRGKIYVLGGLTEGHDGGFVPWLDAFDPATGRWEALPDAPRARDHFHAAVVGGKLYAAGGRTTSARTKQTMNLTIAEVDVFDFQTGRWSTLPGPEGALPTRRAGTGAVAWGEWVLVLGGESGAQQAAHAEVEALHTPTGRWHKVASLARGRHGIQAVLLGDRVYTAAGSGDRGGGPELDSIEVFALPAR